MRFQKNHITLTRLTINNTATVPHKTDYYAQQKTVLRVSIQYVGV